jgi:hypothetical protein
MKMVQILVLILFIPFLSAKEYKGDTGFLSN